MPKNLFHGVLLINKQKSWTSHDVVQKVRSLLNQKQVGHAGTLDPLAEGLMVVLLGLATKLSDYLLKADKRYELTMKFGLTTNTYDLEGDVITDNKVSLKKEDVKNLLENSIGDLELEVPVFSATKVQGKALYSYARNNKEVKVPVKKMSFYDLDIISIEEDSATVSISCSKGSYIRSWVHHLGQKIKTGACLTQLTRTASGDFLLENSLTLLSLENSLKDSFPKDSKELKTLLSNKGSFYLSFESLTHMPAIELTYRDAKILSHGKIPQYLISQSQSDQIEVNKNNSVKILKVIQNDSLIALLELKPFERIKVLKRFPLENSIKATRHFSNNNVHKSTKALQ